MKDVTPKVLEHGATALTTATGTTTAVGSFFGFLNNNAPGLGVILTFMFGCIAVGFHIYSARKQNSDSKELDDLKEELKKIGKRDSDKGNK